MKTFFFICGVALFALTYYYSKNKSRAERPNKATIPRPIELGDDINPEPVETLSMNDVVSYFKMLNLTKETHTPFIMRTDFKGDTIYILAVQNDSSGKIENMKVLLPKNVDNDILSMLGEDNLVVLS